MSTVLMIAVDGLVEEHRRTQCQRIYKAAQIALNNQKGVD
jgi:hypothetical protein